MFRIIRMATLMFITLALIGAILIGIVFLYHLNATVATNAQDPIYLFFVPKWPQLVAAGLLTYLCCLGVSWFYVHQKSQRGRHHV